MQKMVEFVVSGRGAFPIDMLRYDNCWPRTEQDAGVIERTMHPRYTTRTWVVCLKGLARPTEGRWSSFGVTVSDVTNASAGKWSA